MTELETMFHEKYIDEKKKFLLLDGTNAMSSEKKVYRDT